MADRFMYVPMIGLLIIVGVGRAGLPPIAPGLPRPWPTAARSALVAGARASTARAQAAHWSDSVDALAARRARDARQLHRAREPGAGAARARAARARRGPTTSGRSRLAPAQSPGYEAVIHNSLGMVLTRQGKTAEAREHSRPRRGSTRTFAEAQSNLGERAGRARGGSPTRSSTTARRVRLKPDYTEPRVGLGGALLSQRRAGEAIPHYREALRLDPDLAEAHNGLGGALAMEGHDDQAMAEYAEALRLKPDLPTAHLNIALLLIKKVTSPKHDVTSKPRCRSIPATRPRGRR